MRLSASLRSRAWMTRLSTGKPPRVWILIANLISSFGAKAMAGILACVVLPGQPVGGKRQAPRIVPLDDVVASAGIAFEHRFMRLLHTTMHSAAISRNGDQRGIPPKAIA
jgi:hypothetical protein